mmetsp:Transcript_3484/g.5063  ORF Transcript_3484/g.5063 Transcript_3484/m.5063 type:complete len:197 (-) Transcript_3484:886-1476(-)
MNTSLLKLLMISTLTSRSFGGNSEKPYYTWFYSDQEKKVDGTNMPDLSCPPGTYRKIDPPGGLRMEGCLKCPKGTYGTSTELKDASECTPCPKGTYRDYIGGRGPAACTPCPEGTYGEEIGLTTSKCSGYCTDWNTEELKFYSKEVGLTTRGNCKICPFGYYLWQCPRPSTLSKVPKNETTTESSAGDDVSDDSEE